MVALGAVAMLATAGCGSRPAPTKSITVYAASSMIKSFTAIGKDFEAANPGYTVEFVFANSVDLANSLADGADADVFASGDKDNMDVVADAGVVFMTDALAAGDTVSWFALPGDYAKVTAWLAVVKGSDQSREATQFVAEVTSDKGRQILTDNGFYQPASGPAG